MLTNYHRYCTDNEECPDSAYCEMCIRENALDAIRGERQKQIQKHGYTTEHDDRHTHGELAHAAAAYALPYSAPVSASYYWPAAWGPDGYKKNQHTRREQLIIAGAWIVAELERLARDEAKRASLEARGVEAEAANG